MPPDKAYDYIVSKISKREIKLYILSCIIGYIVHYILYSQQLTNPDGSWGGGSFVHESSQWEIELGRWGLYLIDCSRGFLVSPFLVCTISIIIMGIAGLFLLRVLKISSKIYSVIILIMMISMPCFSYTLSYWYCADAYTYAMLFAILSVYFVNKEGSKNFLMGVVCMTMMLGLYQAYLCVTVGLCLICLFIQLYEESIIKYFWKKICRFIAFGISGVGLYWIILQIVLLVNNIRLSDYSGANNISVINSLKSLPQRILHTYYVFFDWMFGNEIILNEYWKRPYFYVLLLVVGGVSFIMLNRMYRKRTVIGVIILLLFPVGISSIEIIAPERDINILLSCGMCLIIPFVLKMTEMVNDKYVIQYICIIVSVLIVWSYILTDNATYLAVQTTTRQTETVLRDIYSDVQDLEDYERDSKYMFAGIIDKSLYKRDAKIYKMSYGSWAYMDSFWNSYNGSRADWFYLYFNLLGMKLNLCSEEEYINIVNSEEFENMSIYPAKNSIKIIDGIVCVKMSQNPPLP